MQNRNFVILYVIELIEENKYETKVICLTIMFGTNGYLIF